MYPKKQYVMARTRGRRTQYFYAERLKDLYPRVKDGEPFIFFQLARLKSFHGIVRNGRLVSEAIS